MGQRRAEQRLNRARRRCRLPVAGAIDDLAHAAEPDAGLALTAAERRLIAARYCVAAVEPEFKLAAVDVVVLFVGTVVDHDVFHSFLVLSLQMGVGQIWVYPQKKFIRTYTDKLLNFRMKIFDFRLELGRKIEPTGMN